MKKESIKSLLSKDFIILFLVSLSGFAGTQLFQSIMSKYAVSLNCPDALLGLVVSSYAVMVLIASIISGLISDQFNKKHLLLISMIGQALATLGYAFLSSNMTILILVRMFHGFCFGLNIVVTMSMVSFAIPKNILGLGMGIYGLGQTFAMAIGPSLGLTIIRNVGYQNMFLVSFMLFLLAAALSFFVSSTPAIKKEKSKIRFRDTIEVAAVPASLIVLCNSAIFGAITSYLIIHAESKGIMEIGLFFTLYAVILLISRPVMGRLADKFSLKYTIYPAGIAMILALVFISLASSLWMFLVAAVALSIGFGGSQPALQAESLRNVLPQKRGAASATFSIGTSSGFAIGPLVAGYIAVSFGFSGMFAFMTIFAVLSMVVMFITDLKRKKSAALSNVPAEVTAE